MKNFLILFFVLLKYQTNSDLKDLLLTGNLQVFNTQFQNLTNEQKIIQKEELLQTIIKIKNGLFDLERFIKRSRDKQIIVPFHQWGQDEDYILIFLKFSHRKDAPGCLDIQSQELVINNNQMIFTATCDQSHRNLEFYLQIDLIHEIIDWNVEKQSVGTAVIKLKKKDKFIWQQLDKKQPVKIWYELKNQTMRKFKKMKKQKKIKEENL